MSCNLVQNHREVHVSAPAFRKRCQHLGISLAFVNEQGLVFGLDLPSNDSFYQWVVNSKIFAPAIAEAVDGWNLQRLPEVHELWEGFYLIPLPAVTTRNSIVSLNVAMIADRSFLETEKFNSIRCEAEQHVNWDGENVGVSLGGSAMAKQQIEMVRCMHDDLHALWQRENAIDQLSEQVSRSDEELSLVCKLSRGMSVSRDPTQFLQDSLNEIRRVIGLRWAALRLNDTDTRLRDLKGKLVISGDTLSSREFTDAIERSIHAEEKQSPKLQIEDQNRPQIQGTDSTIGQLMVIPIVRDGNRIAVLFGADKADGSEMTNVDSRLLTAATQNMAIFLENTMLYEDMEGMFMGTLHALVSSIDAKDSYTFGHSERVAWLSKQLTLAAGLDREVADRVNLSALVHDVGKIGVPESVLTKSGRLTDAEYDAIKTHPEIGVRIIEQIPQMKDLIPGVLHHHERWDGRGYPYGLAGYDIPLYGRIICLADSFDAMSSSRTYRDAMSIEQVFVELDRCAGTQFDPDLTQVFLDRVDLARYYAMLADHQYHESPLRRVLRKTG